ncbi:MAG: thioredoxin domain-containing protein [Pirellulaceae bacterium]|nr:thioredoxin domain-containing protein [Pirellulaceae bacterium]
MNFYPVFYVALTQVALIASGCSSSSSGSIDQASKEDSTQETAVKDEKTSDRPSTKHTNPLAKETSPYLLLHAHNPVNWFAWNDASLKKARDENKVIFLSIGYSSCHWCHVMERESFMDEEIAKILNEHFVCIKVDREERPDVDSIYMNALHAINQGRGGWPLSMFLTPEAQPFFGTTYMPARDGDRGPNTPGFLTLISRVQEVWEKTPQTIISDSNQVTKIVKQRLEASYTNKLLEVNQDWIDDAVGDLFKQFDKENGGFGFTDGNPNRPKFPEPSNLVLLLEVLRINKEENVAKEMLLTSLDRMAMGGIRDHFGGGFHRYSVDRFWRIPHFEKMLYDNAQLVSVYASAYQLFPQDEYRLVIDELLTFVSAELTSPEGGFYSALDAESEDEEGKYYRWTRAEIEEIVGDEADFDLFKNVYQIDREPNFEENFYAPQFSLPAASLAENRGMSVVEMNDKLKPLRMKLFKVRSSRARPLLDTKILSSWNGLMIKGFADAGRVLDNKEYIETASKAALFVLEHLQRDGRLLRTYSGGQAKLNAYLDDYAFLIDGLIALHQATDDPQWLQKAVALQDKQNELFWDEKLGGYFFTSNDHESLLARAKNPVDGARPSGISVSADNLQYLGSKLKRVDLMEKCKQTILAVGNLLQRAPASAPRMLVAVKAYLETKKPSIE